MIITIQRPAIADTDQTISTLYVNDNFFSDVLEDKDRSLFSTDSLAFIKERKV